MTREDKQQQLRQVADSFFGTRFEVRDYNGQPREGFIPLTVAWPKAAQEMWGVTPIVATMGVPEKLWEERTGQTDHVLKEYCLAARVSIEERIFAFYVCVMQGKTAEEAGRGNAYPEVRYHPASQEPR
jgi:hypothetical protein